MKQEKAQYKLRTLVEIVVYAIFSFAIIVLGLYVVPNAFTSFSTNHQIINSTILSVGIGVSFAVVLLIAILYSLLGDVTFYKSLGKAFLTTLIFAIIILAASTLSGFAAELIYAKLHDSKTITEIKGIIDVASKVISVIILPIGTHIFWAPINSSEDKGVKKYLPGITKYFKLVLLLAFLMGVGFMLQVTLPDVLSPAIKVILLTAIGVVSFYICKRVCLSSKSKEKEA